MDDGDGLKVGRITIVDVEIDSEVEVVVEVEIKVEMRIEVEYVVDNDSEVVVVQLDGVAGALDAGAVFVGRGVYAAALVVLGTGISEADEDSGADDEVGVPDDPSEAELVTANEVLSEGAGDG